MEDVIECDYCGGDSYHLATVGYVSHYRCRHCGADMELESGTCEFGMHEEDYNDDCLSDLDVTVNEYIANLGRSQF